MSACNPLKLPVIPKNHTWPSNNIIQLVCIPPKIRDVIILSLKRSKCIFILTNTVHWAILPPGFEIGSDPPE